MRTAVGLRLVRRALVVRARRGRLRVGMAMVAGLRLAGFLQHRGLGHVRLRLHQPLEGRLRKAERADLADGGGIRGARASVEHGDLAEDGAGLGMRERQLAALGRQHRDAHAARDDEIDLAAGVAARKDHLARLEVDLAHLVRDGAAFRLVQRPEKRCAPEKIDNRGLGNHVKSPSGPVAG